MDIKFGFSLIINNIVVIRVKIYSKTAKKLTKYSFLNDGDII